MAHALEPPSGSAAALRPAGARHLGARASLTMVVHLARRTLQSTHRTTLLGWTWPLARQLAQLAVLVFVFSHVLSTDIKDFPVFVFTGLLAWSWFAAGIGEAATSLIDQRHLVLQPRLPAEVIPIVCIAVPFVDVLLAFPVLVLMLGLAGELHATIVLLPAVLAIQGVLMCGVSWLAASVSVYLRDVPNLVVVSLLMLFYLTPVFYDEQTVPARYRDVLHLNPMTTLVEAYRALLLGDPFPSPARFAAVTVGSLLVAGGALVAFRRMSPNFADYL